MQSIPVFKISLITLILFLSGCAGGIDPSLSDEVAKEIVRSEYRYAAFGFWVGVALILLGAALVVGGATGSTSFIATFTGGSFTMPDAPVGFFLIVVGLVLIYITKPDIHSGKGKK